jgi:hypothetical protein
VLERGLRGNALGLPIGADRARVDAACQARQPPAFVAVTAHQLDFAGSLQIGDVQKSVARIARRAGLAHPENEADRLWREERLRLVLPEHGKAARLVEVGGDLGEEFVAGQPDRDGDADVSLDRCGKPRERLRGRHPVQPRRAGEIEKCFVDRERLDQRRERQHHAADLAADAGIFRHIGPDHPGVRAEPQGLEHRHRRFHAEGAGDVAGRGDHAASAAADDHRLGGERWIVALLDRGIEGVAVDVGDGETVELGVAQQPRRAAGGAPRRAGNDIGKAIAAEAPRDALWHVAFPMAAECARGARHLGGIDPGAAGESKQEILVAEHMLQHAGEKAGLLRGGAKLCGRDAAHVEEATERVRLFGDEGKRLNRQHFGGFALCLWCRSIRLHLPFRNISGLASIDAGRRSPGGSRPCCGIGGWAKDWGWPRLS